MTAPLAGLRILDFTHFVAGPWCTMLMADLGADVIKVEPAGRGEISRSMGNVYSDEDSAIFLGFNRGKRSVELDLKTQRGQDIVGRLVTQCDVVIHNFRPDAAARLGLDAATMTRHNPTVIHCAVSAFGESGPLSSAPGNDPLIQGISGAMLATDPDHPVRLGVSLPDFAGGILAGIAVLAAVRRRNLTGTGSVIMLNLLDAQLYSQTDLMAAAEHHGGGRVLQCPDGAVWVDEPCTHTGLYTPAEGVESVLTVAAARGIAAVRVAALSDVLPGPPGRTVTLAKNSRRSTTLVRTPLRFDPEVVPPDRHPPMLGEHTREVLSEFGFNESEIAACIEGSQSEAGHDGGPNSFAATGRP